MLSVQGALTRLRPPRLRAAGEDYGKAPETDVELTNIMSTDDASKELLLEKESEKNEKPDAHRILEMTNGSCLRLSHCCPSHHLLCSLA